MIDTVFGIKVRMSGLCINRYRPIIGRLLDDCLIGASLLFCNKIVNKMAACTVQKATVVVK